MYIAIITHKKQRKLTEISSAEAFNRLSDFRLEQKDHYNNDITEKMAEKIT